MVFFLLMALQFLRGKVYQNDKFITYSVSGIMFRAPHASSHLVYKQWYEKDTSILFSIYRRKNNKEEKNDFFFLQKKKNNQILYIIDLGHVTFLLCS